MNLTSINCHMYELIYVQLEMYKLLYSCLICHILFNLSDISIRQKINYQSTGFTLYILYTS